MKIFVLGIAIGAVVGFAISRMFNEPVPKSYVRVVVHNKSGRVINTLQLRHETGEMNVGKIDNGTSFPMLFQAVGEDSYDITSTFDDNSVITSKGEYVEPGYRREEFIYQDTIITKR